MSYRRYSNSGISFDEIMSIIALMVIILLFAVGLPSCVASIRREQESNMVEQQKLNDNVRVDNIEMVFMHARNDYSIMVDGEIQPIDPPYLRLESVVFLFDVKEGDSNYMLKTLTKDKKGVNVVFHLRDHSSLNGAGWNRGKYGKGQTTIIEQ